MGSVKQTDRFTLFVAALLLLLSWPLQAAVLARLSAPVTSLDQPVRLTLESDGKTQGSPDLSVLEEDFEILGRATQQSMSIINGEVSSKRSLILTLLPKREGELTIPPIPFGDQLTAPLKLEVTQQPTTDDGVQQKLAWVEMSLDKQSAYPEEEVVLTLKLYQAAGVRGEHLDQPELSSGDIRLQLLDESKYSVERDGQTYRVLELNYGLYPSQTGTLEIGPVAFRGRTGGSSVFSLLDDPFGRSTQPSRLIRAQSNPVSLQVRPVPADFSGDHWLPARSIQLVATGIDQSQPILAGKPITRRIMMTADGLMSSQLPTIAPEVPNGIKTYEERPQMHDTPRRTGISSSRENVVTLIPTQAGHYTLPAIEIPWWNTLSGRQEIARLPELELEVMAGATTPSSQTPNAAAPAHTSDSPIPEEPQEATQPTAELSGGEREGVNWLVWLLSMAWILTLAGWWVSHRKHRPATQSAAPPETPTPSTDEAQLETCINTLAAAYRENNAEAAREAWLAWAQQRWPQQPPNNLTRLAARASDPVAKAVLALEKAIYSPGVETSWATSFDPASLRQQPEERTSEEAKPEALLPLNP